jgi:hypothetical protein
VTKLNVLTQETNVESLALLAMFLQRGQYSGHPYQPSANHRDMVFNSFHFNTPGLKDKDIPSPPLITSVVKPSSAKYGFSVNDTMSLYFYEVKTGEAPDICQRLKAQSSMSIEFSTDKHFEGNGVIEGCHAIPVSNGAFREALAFFGLDWMRKNDQGLLETVGDDVAVTLNDLRTFVSLIGNNNIATEEEFKSFLSKFDMGRIFKYDDTQPVEVNTRHFFAFSRRDRAALRSRPWWSPPTYPDSASPAE